nr:RHS repeat-associated core domain-containing protein [Streptomyces sp. SID3343]
MHNSAYRTSYDIKDSLLRARQTQEVTPGGRLIGETFYDTRGWTSRVFNPYYATGSPQPQLVTGDPYGVPNAAWNEFDGLGRITTVISKYLGTEKTRISTIHGGDRTTVVPPPGGIAQTTLIDARGNTTELREYTNADRTAWQSTSYQYADRGLLTKVTDPGNNVWTYAYDVRGRKIEIADPDKGTSSITYDEADRQLTSTDSRNVTLTYDYDDLGRKVAVRNGATVLSSWVFDTVARGQVSSTSRTVDGRTYTATVTGYTDRYQPTETTLTIPPSEGKLAGSYTSKYYYNDRTGAQEMVDLPAVGGLPAETIRSTFDNTTELPVSTSGLISYVQNTLYDNYGSAVRVDMSISGKRVYKSYGYDPHTRRIVSSKVTRDTLPVEVTDTAYAYDAAGNLTRSSEVQGAGAGAVHTDTQCFGYDALRRMTDAWTATDQCNRAPRTGQNGNVGGPDPYWTSYTFDVVGNRNTETRHGLAGTADTLDSYTNVGHKVSSVDTTGPGGTTTNSYGYDAAGNTSTRGLAGSDQTLTWDQEGHLAKAVEGARESTYTYDADGTRLLRRDTDKTTLYLGETELTWTKSDDKVSGTRYYSHADQMVAQRVAKPTGGTTITFVAADPHGSADTVIDGATQQVSRRKLTPFGAPRGNQPQQGTAPGQWPDDKGFLGKPKDVTGLTHIGAREYDPGIGRFVSVDPVLDQTRPAQMHGYTYAANNPMTYSDPSGLDYCPSTECNHYDPGTVETIRGESHEEAVRDVESLKSQRRALGLPVGKSTRADAGLPPPKRDKPKSDQPSKKKSWLERKASQLEKGFTDKVSAGADWVGDKVSSGVNWAYDKVDGCLSADAMARCLDSAFAPTRAWISDHRGLLATVGATAGCFVPAVGWAACAGLQAAAYGVRTEQTIHDEGGFKKNWRMIAFDGVVTGMSGGTAVALRFAAIPKAAPFLQGATGNPGLLDLVKRTPTTMAGLPMSRFSVFQGAMPFHPGYMLAGSVPTIINAVRKMNE